LKYLIEKPLAIIIELFLPAALIASLKGVIVAMEDLHRTGCDFTLARVDRLCEGCLAGAYRDRTLLAIVQRAEALLRSRVKPKKRA
jgi:hypothetical protein